MIKDEFMSACFFWREVPIVHSMNTKSTTKNHYSIVTLSLV